MRCFTTCEVHPRTGHEGPEGEQRYSSTLSFTSAQDGGAWSTPSPGRFTSGRPATHCRWLGGPQGRSGWVRKISHPPGFDPRTVQSVASRYTDYAIPAHASQLLHIKNQGDHITGERRWVGLVSRGEKCLQNIRQTSEWDRPLLTTGQGVLNINGSARGTLGILLPSPPHTIIIIIIIIIIMGGWAGPRANMDVVENRKISCPAGIRTPNRLARILVSWANSHKAVPAPFTAYTLVNFTVQTPSLYLRTTKFHDHHTVITPWFCQLKTPTISVWIMSWQLS